MAENASIELALADIEILLSAYPEEIRHHEDSVNAMEFPLQVNFHLSQTSFITFEFVDGYPILTNVGIASYRSSPAEKLQMERAVLAVKTASDECLEQGIEGGLFCCAAAYESWHEATTEADESPSPQCVASELNSIHDNSRTYDWISDEPFIEKKSVFQAHVCSVASETDVRQALSQLINGSTKLKKATHNMWAYRFTETIKDPSSSCANITILKHDNDDDGEDAAGGRLAQLLHMRNEDGVMVVISRWFGGVLLGSKRFGIITNVAREGLVKFHATI